jgi:competence protein ComEA
MIAWVVGVLGSTVVAQDKPATMPPMPDAAAKEKMSTMSGKKAMPAMGPVDLNSADVATLQKLKGIGPVKARAIVAYRQQHGPFKSVDELKKVKGIGQKTLEQLKDKITVQ